MKNIIYFLVTISLYVVTTTDCKAQLNPVDYDLFIENDVYADNVDTAATTGNIIAINTIFSGGTGNYFATGTTLQDGFTVENGGYLFLSVPITGKRDAVTKPQKFTFDNASIKLYPNPTTDFVSISLTDKVWNSSVRVEVYSLNTSDVLYSTQIQQKNTATITVDLSSLPKGVYILKAYEEKGSEAITRKLIKN